MDERQDVAKAHTQQLYAASQHDACKDHAQQQKQAWPGKPEGQGNRNKQDQAGPSKPSREPQQPSHGHMLINSGRQPRSRKGSAPRKAPSTRGRPLSEILAALEKIKAEHEAQLLALEACGKELQARHVALQIWARALQETVLATQPLRAAVAAAASKSSGGDDGGGCSAASSSEAPACPRFVPNPLQQESILSGCLEQLKVLQLAGLMAGGAQPGAVGLGGLGGLPDGGAACLGGGGGGSGSLPEWAQHLGGDEGAGAMARALSRCTPEAFARRSAEYVRLAAVDLFRVRESASDADLALIRLRRELHRMMALHAGLLVANPCAQARGFCLRLDSFEPMLAPAPREHWVFCVRSMRLSPLQELLASTLLSQYRRAVTAVLATRDGLMREQLALEAFEDEAEAGEAQRLLAEVERCQIKYAWLAMTFTIAFFGDVLTPEQVAAAAVSAFPYGPTLLAIEQALRDIRAEAEAAEQAQAAARAAALTRHGLDPPAAVAAAPRDRAVGPEAGDAARGRADAPASGAAGLLPGEAGFPGRPQPQPGWPPG